MERSLSCPFPFGVSLMNAFQIQVEAGLVSSSKAASATLADAMGPMSDAVGKEQCGRPQELLQKAA